MNDFDELEEVSLVCWLCFLKSCHILQLKDDDFLTDRKEEFYPSDEWLSRVAICDDCYRSHDYSPEVKMAFRKVLEDQRTKLSDFEY